MRGDDEVQERLRQVVDDRLSELGRDRTWLAGELAVLESVVRGWLVDGELPNTPRIRAVLEALGVDVLTFWSEWEPTPEPEPEPETADAELVAAAVPSAHSATALHPHGGVDTTETADAPRSGGAAGSTDDSEHTAGGVAGQAIPSPRVSPEGRRGDGRSEAPERGVGRSKTLTAPSGVLIVALLLALVTTVGVALATTRGPAADPPPPARPAPAPQAPAPPPSYRATAHSTVPPGLRVRTAPRLGDQFRTPVTIPEGSSFEVTCSVVGAEVHDPASSPPVSSTWYRLPDGRSYVTQVYASVVGPPVPVCPAG